MSANGLRLLMQWEGFRTKVYDDAGGAPTIGVGHLLTIAELLADAIMIDGKRYKLRYGLTKDTVLALLAQDVARFEDAINEHVKVPLTQNQFDALCSFVFNVGITAFLKSTLLKAIASGNLAAVPTQLRRWTKVDGREIPGLVNRRENEVNLWLSEG